MKSEKEMTRAELNEIVNEYLGRGGKIRQFKENQKTTNRHDRNEAEMAKALGRPKPSLSTRLARKLRCGVRQVMKSLRS